jgi:hypothetical protein
MRTCDCHGLQREVIRKNAEGSRNGCEATAGLSRNGYAVTAGLSKGSTRSDEGFRASDCAHVFRAPEGGGGAVLGKQLLRSGTSIGANYREAFRARSKAEWSDWAGRKGVSL